MRYFVNKFSHAGDYVYDPFGGRGTTAIECALMGRLVVSNDINPLSKVFIEPRLNPPFLCDIEKRINEIFSETKISHKDNDLYMFYHQDTYQEILSIKNYLNRKRQLGEEDYMDKWIRMVATNRLTGHSRGFFSVYTLPPNQATSKERQIKINQARNQIPEYRNTKNIIMKKSKSLLSEIDRHRKILQEINKKSIILTHFAHETKEIPDNFISLVVTSPPFMDIVDYSQDNWLRCWFNDIDLEEMKATITSSKSLQDWENKMRDVLIELKRVLKNKSKIIFEVGEIKKGKIKLDEVVVKISEQAGLQYHSTLINTQNFTKTANIWGIKNNAEGTNSNRIVILRK